MITLLTGENSFEIERIMSEMIMQFNGVVEHVDSDELGIAHIPDLMMGGTLFAAQRLIVIRNLSSNKMVWNSLGDWIPRMDNDIHLVLTEEKLDKRTKIYKNIKEHGLIYETSLWTERDSMQTERWMLAEANVIGLKLDKQIVKTVIAKVGTDQWLLMQALKKLAVYDSVSLEMVNNLIDANPIGNAFNLFEQALKSDTSGIKETIDTLESVEEPYRLFGLLSSQCYQLAILSSTEKQNSEIAKEIGAHPFVLSKLTSYAKKMSKQDIKNVVSAFAKADENMKTSSTDPWILIESMLLKIALL